MGKRSLFLSKGCGCGCGYGCAWDLECDIECECVCVRVSARNNQQLESQLACSTAPFLASPIVATRAMMRHHQSSDSQRYLREAGDFAASLAIIAKGLCNSSPRRMASC